VVWSWTFILASSLGPRILVCLLSIGFLGVFLQCFFLEQSLDSVLVSVSSIGVLLSRRSRRGGDIRTFRPGFSSTETEMQMILNDESKHSYQSRALLFGYPTLPSYTNLPGWLQAAGKGWLGIRNKKTLQPYESGIDGAIRQWLARVVLPRVLRFPPTKRFDTKEMVLLRVLRFPSTKRIR